MDLKRMDDDALADEVEAIRGEFDRINEAIEALRTRRAACVAELRAATSEQARRENRALEIGGAE